MQFGPSASSSVENLDQFLHETTVAISSSTGVRGSGCDPRYKPRVAWDVLIVFIDLLCFLLTPAAMIHPDRMRVFTPLSRYFDPFGLLLDLILLADIVLIFFTYSHDRSISFQKHRINYIRFWFWLHLASLLPSLFFPASRLLRVFDLFRLWQNFRYMLRNSGNAMLYLFVRLFAFGGLLILLLHLLSSFWLVLGLSQDGSWIDSYDVQLRTASLFEQFTVSYYFVLSLLCTTGNGNVVPQTIEEIWFSLIASVCGVFLISYLMGVSASILIATGSQDWCTLSGEALVPFKQELTQWLTSFGSSAAYEDCEEILETFKKSGTAYDDRLVRSEHPPLRHHFLSQVSPALRLRLSLAYHAIFVDSFETLLLDCDANDRFVEDLLCVLKHRYYHQRSKSRAPRVLVDLCEDIREVLFITSGIALVTGGNSHRTNRGLRVSTGFWFGIHQCTEDESTSPVRIQTICSTEPLLVHYVDGGVWRELLNKHPNVAQRLIGKSRTATSNVLLKVKAPYSQFIKSGGASLLLERVPSSVLDFVPVNSASEKTSSDGKRQEQLLHLSPEKTSSGALPPVESPQKFCNSGNMSLALSASFLSDENSNNEEKRNTSLFRTFSDASSISTEGRSRHKLDFPSIVVPRFAVRSPSTRPPPQEEDHKIARKRRLLTSVPVVGTAIPTNAVLAKSWIAHHRQERRRMHLLDALHRGETMPS